MTLNTRQKMLFTQEEEARIQEAIRSVEQLTSGEVRLYVEDFCDREHPVDRASELFQLFGMFNTRQRNAVLIYVAEKSRVFAIWGDSGIHQRVGFQFWDAEKELLKTHLQKEQACTGICLVIAQIGDQLKQNFPADPDDNENELPDEIIYG
ncbi:MAG: TPM domain-containing protein [Saprospirales bacterium]|nr:TPM domain-containing protein [Saprospirales bacterium]MBK8920083.1 TPM domain-containing protein [Saprospirales bacterium]